jgi:hypothetical protein
LAERIGGKIFPGWVVGFDEPDFFFAREVFQILFAGYGVVSILEALVIDEAVGFVSGGETAGFACAVLGDAVQEIIGDSDVECAGSAGEDVDVILVVVETDEGRVAFGDL